MGAILAGIIQGVGKYKAEQNTINLHAQQQANEEMAQAFDKMAMDQARTPEDAFRLHQMAYTARTKGAKAIPAAQLQYWTQQIGQGVEQAKDIQRRQQQQQSQQVQQAMPIVQQGVTGNPDQQQGAQGPVSRAPSVPTALSPPGGGIPPPNPTSAAAPAAAAVQADQQEAVSPSPKGNGAGLSPPSPGFSSPGIPAPDSNRAWVTPPKRGRFQSPIVDTGGAPLNLRGPEEQQEFVARGAGLTEAAKAQAQLPSQIALQQARYKAEYEGQAALFDRKFKESTEYVDRMNSASSNGGAIWTVSIGANGLPMAKMDRGVAAGTVAGSELTDADVIAGGKPRVDDMIYQRRTYGNQEERYFPTSQTLRLGYNKFGQGVQFNPKIPGDAEAKGVISLQVLPTLRQGFEWKLQQNTDGSTSWVQVPTVSETQKIAPGITPPAPPNAPGLNQQPARPTPSAPSGNGQIPTALPPPPAPRAGGFRSIPAGGKSVNPGDILKYQNSIGIASKQLFGDPDDPALVPLNSYSKLADDPGAKERLGKAFELILHAGGGAGAANIGGGVGPVSFSTGSIGNWLQNSLGIKGAEAQSQAKVIGEAIDALRPDEQAYFNKMMNAIPAITGLRSLTRGAAYKFAQDSLERELPFIGLGTQNSTMFEQKMHALGNEPVTAMENINRRNPGTFDQRLIETARGTKRMPAPSGIAPPAGRMVNMRAPDGTSRPVPADQVDHYKSLGAQVVQ